MSQFIEIPATNQSLAKRKLVYGLGTNDAKYKTSPIINGKKITCPFYKKWQAMLERCYDPKALLKRPNYLECTVCDEWLIFSNFKKWMASKNWQGLQLDKDIICYGNKVYSPSVCLFVAQEINTLLLFSEERKGDYPVGVTLFKQSDKYRAVCRVKGNLVHIGLYLTVQEAEAAYCKFKHDLIMEKAAEYPEISAYLVRHAKRILNSACLN